MSRIAWNARVPSCLLAVVILAGLGAAATDLGAQRTVRKYYAPLPEPVLPAAPVVRDTPANLQLAFTGEMNARTRYLAFAEQARREGYPWVALLFRACGRAEETHADAHVRAIAVAGHEARAVLDRTDVGTTAENLRKAFAWEVYEVTRFYPPLLARARAERRTQAVRSLSFALSAEREHVALLADALATLETRRPVGPIHVCPRCGKTVLAVDFSHCPNCFTGAKRFLQPT